MLMLAFLVIIAAGLWLVTAAVLMALRPHFCLRLLEKMSSNLKASNWRLNLTEQGLRLLAGAALIVHAPASKLPIVFEISGWLVVGEAAIPFDDPASFSHAGGRGPGDDLRRCLRPRAALAGFARARLRFP